MGIVYACISHRGNPPPPPNCVLVLVQQPFTISKLKFFFHLIFNLVILSAKSSQLEERSGQGRLNENDSINQSFFNFILLWLFGVLLDSTYKSPCFPKVIHSHDSYFLSGRLFCSLFAFVVCFQYLLKTAPEPSSFLLLQPPSLLQHPRHISILLVVATTVRCCICHPAAIIFYSVVA